MYLYIFCFTSNDFQFCADGFYGKSCDIGKAGWKTVWHILCKKYDIIRNAFDLLQVSCPSELYSDFVNQNSVSNSLFKLRMLMKNNIL